MTPLLSTEQKYLLVTVDPNAEDIPHFYWSAKQGSVKVGMICWASGNQEEVHYICKGSKLAASLSADNHLHLTKCTLAKFLGPSCPAQRLNTHKKTIRTSSM